MQVETPVTQQPAMDGGGLVRRRVVEHQVHAELCGHSFVQLRPETSELDSPMQAMSLVDHHSGCDRERGKKASYAVAHVVMGVTLACPAASAG